MTTRKILIAILMVSPLPISGCATDDTPRFGAVTTGAGNAIAANTVMQMVDPWPRGVEDADLVVPADHDQYRKEPASDGESDSSDISTTAEN